MFKSWESQLEYFNLLHFEFMRSSQVTISLFCPTRCSIWAVITQGKVSEAAIILIAVITDINIMSSTNCKYVSWIVIISLWRIPNFEYLLIIQLYNKCISIFNPSFIFLIRWLKFYTEVASKCSVVVFCLN